jgi:hypothetical protein
VLRIDEAERMNAEIDKIKEVKFTKVNKLGYITTGTFKGDYCLVLDQCDYINTDRLLWFKIYVNNRLIQMSKHNIKIL